MQRDDIIFNVSLTVAGAFLGLVLTKLTDALELPLIAKVRRKSLTGTWEGIYHQKASKKRPAVDIPVQCWLHPGYRHVRGWMRVTDTQDFSFQFEGGFHHDRYLRLTYTACGSTSDVIDFGSCFLELGDIPNTMKGILTGWGSISQAFIIGEITLKKISAEVPKGLNCDRLPPTRSPIPATHGSSQNP
jgi:hypothetical protein